MRRLEEKYPDDLVVIGVHSGKFIAERDTDNIRAATYRLGVAHPVVNDRQFRTWRAYNVQAWPTVVLIGPDGQYIGQHAGEITFEMFDPVIEAAVLAYSEADLLDGNPLHFPLDPEPQTTGQLHFPGKVLADPGSNRIFIADTGHNRVLIGEFSADGSSARIAAVIGTGDAGMLDGSFDGCMLRSPEGMALDGDTLYIADTENHLIRAAHLPSSTLKTVAGTGEQGYSRAGGPARETPLNSPWDLLVREGWLYIAMAGSHQLWRMNLQSAEVGPLAGSGRENIDDGPNPRATLAQPSGLTTDGNRLFFADSESSAVRASDFAPEGYTQTLLGEGLFEFGDRDGKSLQARLQHCLGVAYYDNRIFIADTYNNKIKVLDLSTKECSSVLGSGEASNLYEPGGLCVAEGGTGARLYIADTNNHRILTAPIEAGGTLGSVTELQLNS